MAAGFGRHGMPPPTRVQEPNFIGLYSWATFLPIWVFLGLCVLDLWAFLYLSGAPCDIATLTFDFGSHGACQ